MASVFQRDFKAPLVTTSEAMRKAAAEHGWSLAEGESQLPNFLTLKRGISVFSWGSKLAVTLRDEGDDGTHALITTSETLALTDWGRGKREASRFFEEAEAQLP
jgi:hypothetical protein